MTILPPAPFPRIDRDVYGSGRGIEEIAVWNLNGISAAPDMVVPPWLLLLSAAVPVTLVLAWLTKETKMAAKKTKMAAKKKRGLSGSPEEHGRRVGAEVRGALRNFETSRKAAEDGKCSLAFTTFTFGAEYAARAELNAADAHRGAAIDRDVLIAYSNAGATFRANCLVTKPLSAPKRRSRR